MVAALPGGHGPAERAGRGSSSLLVATGPRSTVPTGCSGSRPDQLARWALACRGTWTDSISWCGSLRRPSLRSASSMRRPSRAAPDLRRNGDDTGRGDGARRHGQRRPLGLRREPGADREAPTPASEQARLLSRPPRSRGRLVTSPWPSRWRPSPIAPSAAPPLRPPQLRGRVPARLVVPRWWSCHGSTAAADPGFDPWSGYERGVAVLAVNYRGSAGDGGALPEAAPGPVGGRRHRRLCRRRGVPGRGGPGGRRPDGSSGAPAPGGSPHRAASSARSVRRRCRLVRRHRPRGLAAEEPTRLRVEVSTPWWGRCPRRRRPIAATSTDPPRRPGHRSVLLLQGLDDPVSPPARRNGLSPPSGPRRQLRYQAFAGESHGFRLAEHLRVAVTAELGFYVDILGFDRPRTGSTWSGGR